MSALTVGIQYDGNNVDAEGQPRFFNSSGEPFTLKGVSIDVPGVFPVTADLLDAVRNNFAANTVRFVFDASTFELNEALFESLDNAISLATQKGFYVILCWKNSVSPLSPLNLRLSTDAFKDEKIYNSVYKAQQLFFMRYARKYGRHGNMLYELYDETSQAIDQNAQAIWKNELKPYYEDLLRVIREYDSQGIVICPADGQGEHLGVAVENPLSDPSVVYGLHIYMDSDVARLMAELAQAKSKGQGTFITSYDLFHSNGIDGPYVDPYWPPYLSANESSFIVPLAHLVLEGAMPTGLGASGAVWENDQLNYAGAFMHEFMPAPDQAIEGANDDASEQTRPSSDFEPFPPSYEEDEYVVPLS
jgi:hypothetical protein